jgi:oligogalacturonide lyase
MRILAVLLPAVAFAQQHVQPPPASWVHPGTGHRVVRLTEEPGSASLYFNQNGCTASGRKLGDTTPAGIHVLDLASKQARRFVSGRARLIDTRRKS